MPRARHLMTVGLLLIAAVQAPARPSAGEIESGGRTPDTGTRGTDSALSGGDSRTATLGSPSSSWGHVSLNLDGVELLEALKLLIASRDVNLVVAEDVKASVTVHLDHVPFEDALNAVLTINGLSYLRQDHTIYVFRQADAQLMAPQLLRRDVATYRMNYAPLGEIFPVIESFVSPAGRVLSFPATSTLVVEDTPENLRLVERVVNALDVPPRQVLIRAHIVDVTLDDDMSLGIEWDYLRAADAVTEAVDMEASATLKTDGFSPTVSDGLFFSFATSGFEAFLDALQQRTATEILASPTVLALDGREAEIIIGSKLGFRLLTTTTTGNVMETIEFLDVGTQLTLTPHIGDDGLIMLDIHPEVSDGIVDQGLPSETTTETTTSLIVEDGSTILIGGLMRHREEHIRSQVPLLGSIPILGYLFRKTNTTKVKSEVLVAITPHIVTPQGSEHMAREVGRIREFQDRARSGE